jgi:hypothetical protein
VDLCFGPTALAGKESNWVPTKPGRQFEVLFRFYGPEKPLFEKTWKLPKRVIRNGNYESLMTNYDADHFVH